MQGYILNIGIFSYNCFIDLNMEIQQLVNKEKIKKSFREIIISMGENPDRDGLLDTPARLAVLYEELFSGLKLNPDEVLRESFQEPESSDMIGVVGIPFYSVCEHHFLPFWGPKSIHVAPFFTCYFNAYFERFRRKPGFLGTRFGDAKMGNLGGH